MCYVSAAFEHWSEVSLTSIVFSNKVSSVISAYTLWHSGLLLLHAFRSAACLLSVCSTLCPEKNVHLDFWHVKLQLRLAAAACCYIGCISVQLVYTTDHVLKQKVVTLNTCCDIACLTFQLPHITTGFFSEPQTTHNWLFLERLTFERTQRTSTCLVYE